MSNRLAVLCAAVFAAATNAYADPAQDCATVDSVVTASYQAISAPAGAKRDFARLEAIFAPEGRLIMITRGPNGSTATRIMSVPEFEKAYIDFVGPRGFFETDRYRQAEGFGDVATVLSSYESREATDGKPFARGLNSYQLVKSADGWRIQTLLWEDESAQAPLPAKYLPAP